jgi:hypothetical protein
MFDLLCAVCSPPQYLLRCSRFLLAALNLPPDYPAFEFLFTLGVIGAENSSQMFSSVFLDSLTHTHTHTRARVIPV